MVNWFKNHKSYLLMGVLTISILVSLSFISAFTIQSVTPDYINRTIPTIINFTINNTDSVNITSLIITLPMEARFYNTNGTDAAGATFLLQNKSDSPSQIQLNWTNASALIPVNETRSFWFNATLRNIGEFFTNITLEAFHTSGGPTTNSYNYVVNFGFSGFVKNETGGNEGNVNITIYRVLEMQDGPPVETLEANTLSDANGSFSFDSINGSASLYKLKMVRYGSGNCVSSNSTCNATKIGPSLPPFPAMMYYPTTADLPEAEFMRPPTLNGTTFYLSPAATLRLYANNGSDSQKFGYEVVDQKVGFPTESNAMASVSTKDVIVPIGRNFTVMFSRFPSFGGSGFGFYFDSLCDGHFMNDTLCPTPPISNSSLGELNEGQILIVNQSLITDNYRLTGCINTGGNNNSLINITQLSLKMVPWEGFVPPTRGDIGNINLSADISYNLTLHPECNSTYYNNSLAYYNISVMGAASGLHYMLEIYAKNASDESGNPGSANNLAVFQNISISGNTNYNLTLYKLVGGYYSSGTSINTSQIKINIQNSTGGAITNNLNANVKVKNPLFGTVNYMIESMNSGSFYIPILNNTNWAKVLIFPNDAPPKEVTLNLSKSEINITLVTMSDGRGVGMKRINESGEIEMINSTELNDTLPININFLRHTSGAFGSGCNVLVPDSSCSLTSMDAKNFNPLTAMVAGKVNMQMKITSTNVTMTFVNFDMFAAKQPPMDSVIDDQASGSSTADQTWQFGSFAPSDAYDYVIIGMPYSDSVVNDSANINLSIPLFYDENWNVVWNKSRGDTSANLSDDFIDYNNSESGLYRGYLNSGGLTCNKTDSNLNVTPCYVNTTSNMIYMKIPHFSGVGPNVIGTAPSTSPSSSSSSSSSSGGGGATTTTNTTTPTTQTKSKTHSWTKITPGNVSIMKNFDKDMGIKEIQISVNNPSHNVKIKVTKYSGKPAAVSVEKSGKVYKYLHIETTNLKSNLSKAIVRIQVEKSWLNNNSLDKNNIALFKFNESSSKWNELKTTFAEEDADYDYYDTELTSFSYFAISEKAVTLPEIINNATTTGSTGTSPETTSETGKGKEKGKMNLTWLWILIIIIVVGTGVFFTVPKIKEFYENMKARRVKVVNEKMGNNKIRILKEK